MLKKYDVLIHQYNYEKDRIYVTAGFNFGFALNYYSINNQVKKINSSAIVLLSYLKEQFAKNKLKKKINIKVNAGNTFINFVSNKKIETDMNLFFKTLQYLPSRDEFQQLKESFDKHYIQEYNRKQSKLYLKLLEFLQQNKRFSVDDFHEKLEKVTFEDVKFVQDNLFDSMICRIHLLGNLSESTQRRLIDQFPKPISKLDVRGIAYPLDNSDSVWKEIQLSHNEFSEYILLHSTSNSLITTDKIFLVYQVINEKYCENNPILFMDVIDKGMLIKNLNQVDIENISNKELGQYIQQFIKQVEYMLKKFPRQYGQLFVLLWSLGYDYLAYYEQLKSRTVEEVKGIITEVMSNTLQCKVQTVIKT